MCQFFKRSTNHVCFYRVATASALGCLHSLQGLNEGQARELGDKGRNPLIDMKEDKGREEHLPIRPDLPTGLDLEDFRRLQSFEFAIIPLTHIFGGLKNGSSSAAFRDLSAMLAE